MKVVKKKNYSKEALVISQAHSFHECITSAVLETQTAKHQAVTNLREKEGEVALR